MNEPRKSFSWLVVFALCMVFAASPRSAAAAVPPGWLTTVHGIAVTKRGQPVIGLTLYFSAVPGYPPGGVNPKPTSAITDASGRFTLDYDQDSAVDPDYLIPTYALMPDRRAWDLAVRTNGQRNDEYDLYNTATIRCETHWTDKTTQPLFTVVVPDPGVISVLLRAPDGRPVVNHPVKLVPDANQAGFSGVITYSGHTDSTGHVTMRCAPGLAQFQIAVPGVGFGSTGVVNVLPGQTALPPLARLAPFGTIIGTVAPPLAKPDATISIDNRFPDASWYAASAKIQADGTFSLADVLPGSHPLIVSSTAKAKEITVSVAPGQIVQGVSVLAKDPPRPIDASQYVSLNPLEPPHSAHGKVTDTAGNPVSGATVYAIYTIPDSHGFASRKIFTTLTDAAGEYAVGDPDTGDTMPSSTPLDLLVSNPGMPPALAHATGDPNDYHHRPPTDIPVDIVLSDRHTRLTVRVLSRSVPATGAAVKLTQEPTRFQNRFLGKPDATSAAVDRLLQPTAMTDADGNAVFIDIAPGLWRIDAILRPDALTIQNAAQYFDATAEFPYFVPDPEYPHARRTGIAVQVGRDSVYSLDLTSWTRNVAFLSLTPQGTLIKGDSLEYQAGMAGESYAYGPSARSDDAGKASLSIIAPGLWRIAARNRTTPANPSSPDSEPYEEASVVIAASPAVDEPRPITLHTARRGPGSIRVSLLNRRGKPLAGAVAIKYNGSYGIFEADGTVDKSGAAAFKNLPSGSYTVTATRFGALPLPTLGKETDPLPSDSVLAGQAVILPKTVTVNPDSETGVLIQEQPVGYVRGRVLARPGDPPMTYNVYGSYPLHLDSTTRINQSNEFVTGPYLPGKTSLVVQPLLTQGAVTVAGPQVLVPVSIGPGQVTRIEVPAQPVVPFDEERAINEKSDRPLSGIVFLPDGKTPAWGARAKVFLPDRWDWEHMAKADALGILAYDYEYSNQQIPEIPPPGSPTVPVVVAYLPGSHGAVIAPYTPGGPVRLVLPPAVSLHGRVTVGGQSVTGLASTFTIQAAYQGKGKLNDLLSIETTAQADGSFDLDGLTPGVYQVQAARDGIWLSRTQTVVVGQDALPDRTFDIGPPGRAMLFHFRDQSGNPLIGKTVTLVRPDGPLTDALWPKTLTTDGAGDLRLEGLEAGPQSMIVEVEQASGSEPSEKQKARRAIRFVVPDYAPGEQAVEKTITGMNE